MGMKAPSRKLSCTLVFTVLAMLSSCEKYPEGDGKYCVTCTPEWDDEVNWVYNVSPTKLCEFELEELQIAVNEYIAKGYSCGEIREP